MQVHGEAAAHPACHVHKVGVVVTLPASHELIITCSLKKGFVRVVKTRIYVYMYIHIHAERKKEREREREREERETLL